MGDHRPATLPFSELMDMVALETGAVVNFEDVLGVALEVPHLRLRAEQHSHHGSYCEFAKLQGRQADCSRHKVATLKKAERERRGFAVVCPQGVWDWCQPVEFEGEVVAVLYLGSLSCGRRLARIGEAEYAGPALQPVTDELAERIAAYGEFLATALRLIRGRWVAGGNRLARRKPAAFYAAAAREFVRTRYQHNVGLADLAAQLRVHPNYLGKLIRDTCGRSFRQLLLDHRVAKAKVMLRTGDRTVTEIAYACGFRDSNYFSTAFRRVTGMAPSRFAEDGSR